MPATSSSGSIASTGPKPVTGPGPTPVPDPLPTGSKPVTGPSSGPIPVDPLIDVITEITFGQARLEFIKKFKSNPSYAEKATESIKAIDSIRDTPVVFSIPVAILPELESVPIIGTLLKEIKKSNTPRGGVLTFNMGDVKKAMSGPNGFFSSAPDGSRMFNIDLMLNALSKYDNIKISAPFGRMQRELFKPISNAVLGGGRRKSTRKAKLRRKRFTRR